MTTFDRTDASDVTSAGDTVADEQAGYAAGAAPVVAQETLEDSAREGAAAPELDEEGLALPGEDSAAQAAHNRGDRFRSF